MKPENFVIPTLPQRTPAKQLIGGLLLARALQCKLTSTLT